MNRVWLISLGAVIGSLSTAFPFWQGIVFCFVAAAILGAVNASIERRK